MSLGKFLRPNKVLVIFGPRQVGKTTLLKDFLEKTKIKYRLDSGENLRVQRILGSQDFEMIKEYAQGYKLIAIDEAQRIPQVGMGLKILVDQNPGIKVIATGSSSFELAGSIGEPLTGRKITMTLFPVAQIELAQLFNPEEMKNHLSRWLIFGGYPEVVTAEEKSEKIRIIEELTNSYLLKDILELKRVKNSRILVDILRLLAFQIGSEVSLSEIGSKVGIDTKTVGRYLDLLEKSFVIFQLRGYSRNLRSEMTKKSKYYFFDLGVRNAIISNFNSLELRNDIGGLWENFLIMERWKKRVYTDIPANMFFWRTWEQKEIDLVEEREGKLFGYEFKWSDAGKAKEPHIWTETYPEATWEIISPKNYLRFIC
ncbi:MAG: ATP-binding protein [Candidatus Ozemobacteraceae bacterium]